jgi:hypothetical protein
MSSPTRTGSGAHGVVQLQLGGLKHLRDLRSEE